MWSIGLGQDEGIINQIVLQIMNNPPPLDAENISEIMRHLKIPAVKRKQILDRLRTGQIQVYEAFEEILHNWLSRESQNATVEALIDFLKKCGLQNHALALKIAFKLQTTKETEPVQNFATCSNNNVRIDDTTASCSSPMISQSSNSEYGNKKYIKKKLWNCFSVISIIILLSIAGMVFSTIGVLFLVDRSQGISSRTLAVEHGNTTVTLSRPILNTTKEPVPSKSIERCINNNSVTHVVVHSYQAFESYLSNLQKHCYKFSLKFTSGAAKSWPKNSSILVGAQIKEISFTDSMPVENIIGILQQTPNLQNLNFDNTNSQLCAVNENNASLFKEIPYCSTALTKLEYLNMTNFGTCDTLITMMLACLKIHPKLIEFHGDINDENLQQISVLFGSLVANLTGIKIRGNFDTQTTIMPTAHQSQVKSISVDVLNKSVEKPLGTNIIENSFCGSFPALSTLIIKGGYFGIDDIWLFQGCKALNELSLDLLVSEADLKNISFSYFRVNFPVLESLDMHLFFRLCPSSEILEKFANEFRDLKSLTFCSNCVVSSQRNSKCHRKRLT